MKTKKQICTTGEITNTCTCTIYNDKTNKQTGIPADFCYGDCWEDSVSEFTEVTKDFREQNETDYWRVENLRLWNGGVSGVFHADKVEDILRGTAVKGEWRMRYTVFSDRIEYSLSHHDSPMGRITTLYPVSEEEYEKKWRY